MEKHLYAQNLEWRLSMKVGDLIRFKGSWVVKDGPQIGVVTSIMYNGITKKPASANIFWEDGTQGSVMAMWLEVIGESR